MSVRRLGPRACAGPVAAGLGGAEETSAMCCLAAGCTLITNPPLLASGWKQWAILVQALTYYNGLVARHGAAAARVAQDSRRAFGGRHAQPPWPPEDAGRRRWPRRRRLGPADGRARQRLLPRSAVGSFRRRALLQPGRRGPQGTGRAAQVAAGRPRRGVAGELSQPPSAGSAAGPLRPRRPACRARRTRELSHPDARARRARRSGLGRARESAVVRGA